MASTDALFKLGFNLVREWLAEQEVLQRAAQQLAPPQEADQSASRTKKKKTSTVASSSDMYTARCPLHPPPQVGMEQVSQGTPRTRARRAA